MREELNVNVHRQAFQQRKNQPISLQDTLEEAQPTGVIGWIKSRFDFPGGELAIVTSRGDKVSIPTPMIGALLALFMWMVGGTIGFAYFMGRMSSSVDSLNGSFMQYQIRADAEKKAMQEKIDLQQMYITDLREKQARNEGKRTDN